MKFSTRQDIDAPVDFVFEKATDFTAFERQAMRRGVQVDRVDEMSQIAVGMQWTAGFSYRGRPRQLRAELSDYDPPHSIMLQSASGGVEADLDVEFLPLSRNRTRIRVGLTLHPKTLPARLLIQSLKLTKAKLDARFSKRVRDFAAKVEGAHAKGKSSNYVM